MHSVIPDSLWPYRLETAGLLCPWGFSRQEYWSFHFLLQGIFPAQGSNPGLLHSRQIDSLPTEPHGNLHSEGHRPESPHAPHSTKVHGRRFLHKTAAHICSRDASHLTAGQTTTIARVCLHRRKGCLLREREEKMRDKGSKFYFWIHPVYPLLLWSAQEFLPRGTTRSPRWNKPKASLVTKTSGENP